MDRLQSMKIFACVVESGGFYGGCRGSSGCRRPRSPVMLRRWVRARPASARTHHPAHAPDRKSAKLPRAMSPHFWRWWRSRRDRRSASWRAARRASAHHCGVLARVHLAPAIAEYMQQYPETAFEADPQRPNAEHGRRRHRPAFRITGGRSRPGGAAPRTLPRGGVCRARLPRTTRQAPKPSDLSDHDCSVTAISRAAPGRSRRRRRTDHHRTHTGRR